MLTTSANWFDKLTLEQLQKLCEASKKEYTGTRSELILTLLTNPATAPYALEGRRGSFSDIGGIRRGKLGTTVEMLKEACLSVGENASGTKFDLVLRLVEHASFCVMMRECNEALEAAQKRSRDQSGE